MDESNSVKCLLGQIFFCESMETNAGILALIDKMVNEATSPDVETFFVSTRLKNDIIVTSRGLYYI